MKTKKCVQNHRVARPTRQTKRPNRQGEEQKDTLMNVIGMQIMLCIIMLASMMLLKHFDLDKYNKTRQSMENIASIEVSTNDLKNTMNVFSFSYDYVGNIIEKTATEIKQRENSKEDKERVYGEARLTGQGGLNPVKIPSKTEPLAPPRNATFAPIMTSASLTAPVAGVVTSGFGYRYHPMSGKMDFHTGIDIATQMNTPILAVLPGRVSEIGSSDIYGNYINIEHGNGFVTTYSHCSEIIAEVGTKLKRGERIAKVGSTGVSTGPHLHFEILINNMFVDPSWVLL